MLAARTTRSVYGSCRKQLLSKFEHKCLTRSTPLLGHLRRSPQNPCYQSRRIHSTSWLQASHRSLPEDELEEQEDHVEREASPEQVAKQAHEDFGGIIPEGYLEEEELAAYKSLYGEPALVPPKLHRAWVTHNEFGTRIPENWLDVEELQIFKEQFCEDEDSLEIIPEEVFWPEYQNKLDAMEDAEEAAIETQEVSEEALEIDDAEAEDEVVTSGKLPAEDSSNSDSPEPISWNVRQVLEDLKEQGKVDELGKKVKFQPADYHEFETSDEVSDRDPDRSAAEEYLDDIGDDGTERGPRTHPHTQEGRSGTDPSTLFLPKDTFINPIADVLAKASNKHLKEFAFKTFGGRGLPNSVATPSTKGHLHQKPIALEASQATMKVMEANAYVAAMMPGLYASLTGVFVETRKRLGSAWLENLLQHSTGPNILDAGGAGAGVLAFRDIIRAEWERMHPDGESGHPPLGKASVVTGSPELRTNISQLLDNTSFLPRIPDFSPSRDIPGAKGFDASARKQYDIIIAPHTLWKLQEDYNRKHLVQNLWSLLNPDGGVLVILEKGVPRGFELVAGAREALLDNHILSPADDTIPVDNMTPEHLGGPHSVKERGMIIAPCTNHGQCPMYTIPGAMSKRKDYCHFQQRYQRPLFLQRVLGDARQNHEDIRFSYVAVQRGKDIRHEKDIAQNEEATLAALNGYEGLGHTPSTLSLPRVVLPPLKRDKHVTFDVCTPSAQIERWTMPRSKSKQGYRDARKARWGDLWALGAKTRVIRKVRSGEPKPTGKPKRTLETELDELDDEDLDSQEWAERPPTRKQKDGRKSRPNRNQRKVAEELD